MKKKQKSQIMNYLQIPFASALTTSISYGRFLSFAYNSHIEAFIPVLVKMFYWVKYILRKEIVDKTVYTIENKFIVSS